MVKTEAFCTIVVLEEAFPNYILILYPMCRKAVFWMSGIKKNIDFQAERRVCAISWRITRSWYVWETKISAYGYSQQHGYWQSGDRQETEWIQAEKQSSTLTVCLSTKPYSMTIFRNWAEERNLGNRRI